MVILSKKCEPDNFESHNPLNLSFTNIWCLPSNFAECETFLESNSPDILALCKTNNWFCQFLCERLSFFNPKGFYYSYAWSPSLCEGGNSFVARDLSLETSADSYLCFRLALLHSVFYFFFLYWWLFSSLCTVFESISSNIVEVLSISPSANVFFFGDYNIHHKDWITYSGGTDRSSELC